MKHYLRITLACLMLASLTTLGSSNSELSSGPKPSHAEFCKGFNDGYIDGWCDLMGEGCIEPPVPQCPPAKFGDESYRAGYKQGYAKGQKDF